MKPVNLKNENAGNSEKVKSPIKTDLTTDTVFRVRNRRLGLNKELNYDKICELIERIEKVSK